MTPEAPTFSVIIPAYNEEAGIGATLSELMTANLNETEIIVVDDGSKDRTAVEVARFVPDIRLIQHRTNRGYGSAIATGARHARGRYILWYDSDGQHQPADLLRLMNLLSEKQLEYCIGVRVTGSYEDPRRRFGKFILRIVVRMVVGQPVADFNSGLRGFQCDILLRYLHLLPPGFGASTMTTLLMYERNHVGEEIPITARERIGKSSVKQFRDGVRTLMIILRIFLLFRPMHFFGGIGLALIAVGSIYGFAEAISVRQGFPVFGALIIILGIQSLFFGLLNDQLSLLRRERLD